MLAHCRGFGICGWIGVGTPKPVQPLVVAAAGPAGTGPRCTLQGPRPLVPDQDLLRLRHSGAASASGPTRKPVLKVRAHLVYDGEGRPAGWTQVDRDYSPDNLMPQGSASAATLPCSGPGPPGRKLGPTRGNLIRPRRRPRTRDHRPDSVGRSSLSETLNSPLGPVPRRPFRLDSDAPAGRQPPRWACASAGA